MSFTPWSTQSKKPLAVLGKLLSALDISFLKIRMGRVNGGELTVPKLKINVVAELVFEFFDIFGGCRRDAKVVQARLIPAAEVVPAIRLNIEIDLAIGNRPDEHINN